jgi:hypothetical protein
LAAIARFTLFPIVFLVRVFLAVPKCPYLLN